MEKLHSSEPKKVSGKRVLRLTSIVDVGNDQHPDNLISVQNLRKEYVLGGGLSSEDELIIDGKDALSLLPRPEAYGSRALALMSFLDSSLNDAMFQLEIEEESVAVAAAD
jgi:hypothetical protein